MFENLLIVHDVERECQTSFRRLSLAEIRAISPNRYTQMHVEQLNAYYDAHFPYTVRKTVLDRVLRPWLNETVAHRWAFTATNVLFEDELDAAKYKLMWV